MDKTEVSVIVPAYNAEDNIERTLRSILAAEEVAEVLVVNDGSTDGTADVVRKVASQDARVRLLSQDNSGVSTARNHGLDYARYKWVSFVDSDDMVTPDFFKISHTEESCDVIIKRVFDVDAVGTVLRERTGSFRSRIITDRRRMYTFYLSGALPSCWNKIYKRDVIGTLRFHRDLVIGEDLVFTTEIAQRAESFAISSTGAYLYYINPYSVMRRLKKDPRRPIETTFAFLPKLMDATSCDLPFQRAILARYVLPLLYHSRKHFTSNDKDRIRQIFRDANGKGLSYLSMRYRAKYMLVRRLMPKA